MPDHIPSHGEAKASSRYWLSVSGHWWNGWPGTKSYPVSRTFYRKYCGSEAIIRDRMVLGLATEFANAQAHNVLEATNATNQ